MATRKRKPRRLVVGHLERISSAAFDTYSKEITHLVGDSHGIYALYRNNQLHYVGLAKNLKSRVRNHLKDRHAGKWNYFSLYLVRSERHLHDLESLAIRVAYPKGNKTRGKFGGAPDLRRLLKAKMTERAKREIAELMGKTPAKRQAAAGKPKTIRTSSKKKQKGGAPLKGLLSRKRLRGTYRGKTYRAWAYSSGRIRLTDTGELHDTPSGAAAAVTKHSLDGWHWWRYRNKKGEWVRLDEVRKKSRK